MPEQRTKVAAIAAFVALCLIWSSTWLAIKFGLRDLPPVSFVAIRFMIAVAVLLAISIGRVHLLPPPRFRRNVRVLGRRCNRFGRGWRGPVECLFESARDSPRTSDDRRVANDLRPRAADRGGTLARGQSAALSLDRARHLLPFLPGDTRLRPRVSSALLAAAANVGHKSANDFLHYAARSGPVRMAARRREFQSLVPHWRRTCPHRCLADFPQSETSGT